MTGRIQRLTGTGAGSFRFVLDGEEVTAHPGDTLLTAILSHRPTLRPSDAGPETRAGFCLMGACQDCWIWQEQGPRVRACSTDVTPGMRVLTNAPEGWLT